MLAVLLVLRVVRYPRIASSPTSPPTPRGSPSSPTVAGTNVLGRGLGDHPRLVGTWPGCCGGSALGLWVVFVYTTLIAVVIGGEQAGARPRGINGTWFLLTVGTESVAVARRACCWAADGGDLLAFVASPRSRSDSCCT